MTRLLSVFVFIFGAICVLIALAHIALGPQIIPGSITVTPTMDSEDRFYAVMFLGWGAAIMYCALDLRERGALFGALLLTFFLGGIARIISALMVGLPSLLFIFLGLLELALPPWLWRWYRNVSADLARPAE